MGFFEGGSGFMKFFKVGWVIGKWWITLRKFFLEYMLYGKLFF